MIDVDEPAADTAPGCRLGSRFLDVGTSGPPGSPLPRLHFWARSHLPSWGSRGKTSFSVAFSVLETVAEAEPRSPGHSRQGHSPQAWLRPQRPGSPPAPRVPVTSSLAAARAQGGLGEPRGAGVLYKKQLECDSKRTGWCLRDLGRAAGPGHLQVGLRRTGPAAGASPGGWKREPLGPGGRRRP